MCFVVILSYDISANIYVIDNVSSNSKLISDKSKIYDEFYS